jgi:methyl-accepting chemotaxis protein
MNKGLAGLVAAPLRGSIKNQLMAMLGILMVVGATVLAVVFYLQARSVSLGQMENSYRSLGDMVASLSAYDIQFNRSNLKNTEAAMLKADPNLLWVEYADAKGKVLESGGTLKSPPTQALGGPVQRAGVKLVASSAGQVLLVRAPIVQAQAAPASSTGELGFEPSAPAAPAQAASLGELRLVVGLAPLAQLRRGYLGFGLLVVLLTLLAGAVVSVPMVRYLMAPLGVLTSYASEVAGGKLTGFRGRMTRQDELGRLVTSFEGMAGNLSQMIRKIRDAFRRVEEGTQNVSRHLNITLSNTQNQEASTHQVQSQVDSIQKAVQQVSRLMEDLSQLAEEVSSSVLEMIASIDEIATNTEGLNDAVNTVASTLSQNVAGIRQIDSSAETLNTFVEETSAAMNEMESSIRQIEENAIATRKATELVASEALAGNQSAQHSSETIQKLQVSFEATTGVMKLLGQRSEEVGNILQVIDEVMEQTHLLALNAAIIAAQAGEHGKAFAVVAQEIKELAGKTSVSTREIAGLIDAVQHDVRQAVETVNSQRSLVDNSVAVTNETRKTFDRIQGAVRTSLQMVEEIARATTEQAKGTLGIVRSTEKLRDLAQHLRRGTKEQSLGSQQIIEAMDRIRSLSEEMKRATSEQSAGSALIRQAMDRLTAAVAEVLAQNQAQGQAGKEVERVMEDFASASRSNLASIREATGQVDSLSQRAEEVARVISQFQIEE